MLELIGKTLAGRYRVDSFVGRGGMAEVYKVWDQDRATYLAMKVLREDLAQDPVFLRRFQREAATLADLQHPHIVRFYGLERDNLLSFMLMDFVEGQSLRAEVFRRDGIPLELETIVDIMRAACSALHFAHRRGLVHCDMKPGNVMIDQSGRVLIADFGIARMTDAATATMVGMGTPAYMAPEQVYGGDPAPQTDIYALGVMLFVMVTGGERPFTGELAETTGSTAEKVRWEQLHLDPPSPRRWNPELPPGVENVIMRCLAKDPTARYETALDVFNDLSMAAHGEEVTQVDFPAAQPDTIVEVEPAAETVLEEAAEVAAETLAEEAPEPVEEVAAEVYPPHPELHSDPLPEPTPTPVPIQKKKRRFGWWPLSLLVTGILGLIVVLLAVGGILLATRVNVTWRSGAYKGEGQGDQVEQMTSDGANFDPAFAYLGGNLAFASDRDGDFEIYVLDENGQARQMTFNEVDDIHPTYSAAGSSMAFASDRDGDLEIYTLDESGAAVQLTFNDANDFSPVYAPNSGRLAFVSDRDGDFEIYELDSSGNVTQLTFNDVNEFTPSYSPTGGALAFASDRDGDFEIYILGSDGVAEQMTFNTVDDFAPEYTPAGGELVFASARSGRHELYILGIDGTVKQLTTRGGEYPAVARFTTMIAFVRDGDIYTIKPE